jgi:transposase
MTNRSQARFEVFAGLDVSARQISVARRRGQEEKPVVTSFANNASGHKALLTYLLQASERVRVCLEASGNYSLDLALTLQAHRQVEVSLVNPCRARHFAQSLGARSKTDPVDACVLCEYAARLPWMPWQPPRLSSSALACHNPCHRGFGRDANPRKKS